MKPVDIYIERASTHHTINTVELNRATGLYTPSGIHIGCSGGIRRAQLIRNKRIAEWKEAGLVVKGCNNLIAIREELFESLYRPGYTIQTSKEMYQYYNNGFLFYVDGSLQSSGEFSELPVMFLGGQVELGNIHLAIKVA